MINISYAYVILDSEPSRETRHLSSGISRHGKDHVTTVMSSFKWFSWISNKQNPPFCVPTAIKIPKGSEGL